MRILVATWGSPLGWTPSRYKSSEEGIECPSEKTFASLSCFKNSVDHVIVLALDSSIAASQEKKRGINMDAVECAKEAGLHVGENSERIWISPPSNLKEGEVWRRKVVEYIGCLMRRALGRGSSAKTDVVVAPAKGKLGPIEYKWAGHRDFLSIALLELYRVVREELDEINTIYLDVTHGVNLVPVLSLELAYLLASLALISREGAVDVKVRVFNAVPSGDGGYELLRIHDMDVPKAYLSIARRIEGKEGLILRSLAAASPLALYYLCKDFEFSKVEEELINELNEYWRRTDVRAEDNVMILEREGAKGLKDLEPDVVYAKLLAINLCKLGWSNRVEEISKRVDYFRKISKLHEYLVRDEINDMQNRLRAIKVQGCVDYYKVRCKGEDEARREMEEIKGGNACSDKTIRNFISHAGLLDSIVKICDNKVEYVEWSLVERVLGCREIEDLVKYL